MSMDMLKEDLKNNKIRNLYLFYGHEEYLKRYYLDSIEKALLREDLKSLNRVFIEGKTDAGKIIEACETLPVFSERKIVIVKNSGIFKAKKESADGKSKGKGQADEFLWYLQNIPGHVCLVFYESEIDKRIKLVEAIRKSGLMVEFDYQKPEELTKWIIKVFKANKKEIDTLTASQLIDSCELGMNEILNEVNKLVQFMGDRDRVTGSDIEKVCTKSIKSRIFDLTDALSEGNKAKAIKLLEEMILLKEPVPRIFFMLTRQIRLMFEIKLLSGKGMRPDEIAPKMKLNPYAAGKIQKHAGKFAVEKLKKALEECLEYDVAIKNGKISDRMAVELLIASFSK